MHFEIGKLPAILAASMALQQKQHASFGPGGRALPLAEELCRRSRAERSPADLGINRIGALSNQRRRARAKVCRALRFTLFAPPCAVDRRSVKNEPRFRTA